MSTTENGKFNLYVLYNRNIYNSCFFIKINKYSNEIKYLEVRRDELFLFLAICKMEGYPGMEIN